MKPTQLDLRYNEMWKDWDGTGECRRDSRVDGPREDGQLVLSWKRLNVSAEKIKHKFFGSSTVERKQILCNVSGNAQCGNLLGIMGPSGSGKTTLMATISHRTKGNFDGELLLNGKPVSEKVMIKISGFVPQHDISFEQLTTYEHLHLMAHFKMDRRMSSQTMEEQIDHLESMLGMRTVMATRLEFLSGGERKKVALAVQLLNDPPILFCDEITTGLDSYSAAHIVNTLRCIARTGKIVICTIHQPASGVFDKFDEVVLLSNGRLAYQGPVPSLNRLFLEYNYEFPDMYNKADFVISILNSESDAVKTNVDKMCKISSTDKQIDLNYGLFNEQKQLDYSRHLQIQKPLWNTQLRLILKRSSICILRNYKLKLLELGTILFLGLILSLPYQNLKFDAIVVQNLQGFWFCLITNSIFQYCYVSIITYQTEFSVVHREVSNDIYALSVYYISQIIITFIWTILESLIYIFLVFWIVGIEWHLLLVTTFTIIMLTCRAYGSVLSAFFEKLENVVLFSLIYDYLAIALSGAYLSLGSLPPVLYYLKYFSLFYLGCETVSILQWQHITYIPCLDVNNDCLRDGKEVLMNYGYNSDRFYLDLIILVLFYFTLYAFGYYGLLRRIKKQPAY
ncbi:AAA+ ATPase domain,P-loop containing nucleoside triphosphate hydrolase,ABC transporter, conserved site,ABC [Cinara cedri]|uniref:AAA+ ATPase domain,P-loop containing nucleoside triphosphate hydrolase,ABC transporter, conserved site,ABC n=1 Tax=Cinara cedri TaxID=506608 RepID=A0A5E4MHF2_9HEMI|nr:AAA+ ATPase domain,P-loop containing nucleoside triphosphate hydrolase,ABC transporter, conserved site,ABC [Cinara cedri]